MTAPREREQDSEARVKLQINERFKSLSIRNIKNHSNSLANGASSTTRAHAGMNGALGRRRNMVGTKILKDLGGISGNRNRNLSPQMGAGNLGHRTTTSNMDDTGNTMLNLT